MAIALTHQILLCNMSLYCTFLLAVPPTGLQVVKTVCLKVPCSSAVHEAGIALFLPVHVLYQAARYKPEAANE